MSDNPVFVDRETPGYVHVPYLGVYVLVDDMHVVIRTLQELNNPEFAGRRHGTRNLRNQQCNGPLCALALRQWMRKRQGSVPSPRLARHEELLDKFISRHYNELDAAKSDLPNAVLIGPLV